MDKIQRREKINAVARDLKQSLSDDFLDRGADWIKAWFEFDLKWSDGDSGFVTLPLTEVEPFATAAEANFEVLQLAKYVVGTRLRVGAEVPHQIGILVAPSLLEALPETERKNGDIRTVSRDFVIIQMMNRLVDDDGFEATRGLETPDDETRDMKASEFIFEALKEKGLKNMPLSTIQTIWARKKNRSEVNMIRDLQLRSKFDDDAECVRV
jgi:hypothetical protein